MKEEYKEDLRIVRTRKLLSRALFELLETTPYEKISVLDICEHAMVHRATFYNHFEDKEHLLEYTIDTIKEELFNATIEKENYTTPKEMYMTLISKVIDFALDNKNKLLLILKQNSFEKANELILTTVKRSIQYLTSKNKYKENYSIPVNLMTDFFAGGITNLGLNWLQSPNPCSKQDLIKYFDILLDDRIYIKN